LDLIQFISDIRKKEASDLHLEPGLSPVARIHGALKPVGNRPLEPAETATIARSLLNEQEQRYFSEHRAVDFSQVLGGIHCRVNVMKTQRGIGLAIRLLSSEQPTLTRLNLHPCLADFVKKQHGLILICGPTGCGKSSTLAALIHEINIRDSLHIVTIESPVEYAITPRRSLIRQREVGRDTPSFERALIDALRQDPDVIMVGEMRDREIIQLTLNAAETGQLVLSTLHASSTSEALQRVVAAFPPDIQSAVSAQLADCLIGAVSQRLPYHEKLGIRIPLCEIMASSHPVRHLIRQGHFFKLPSVLETGHADGNWTTRRYQEWLDSRDDFYVPENDTGSISEPIADMDLDDLTLSKEGVKQDVLSQPKEHEELIPTRLDQDPVRKELPADDIIVIEEPDEGSLEELLKKMGDPPDRKDQDGKTK